MKKVDFYKVWTDGSVEIIFEDGEYRGFRCVDDAVKAGFKGLDADRFVVKLRTGHVVEGKKAHCYLERVKLSGRI